MSTEVSQDMITAFAGHGDEQLLEFIHHGSRNESIAAMAEIYKRYGSICVSRSCEQQLK